jgi:hypothetical protein
MYPFSETYIHSTLVWYIDPIANKAAKQMNAEYPDYKVT